jgi:hypothetical protein
MAKASDVTDAASGASAFIPLVGPVLSVISSGVGMYLDYKAQKDADATALQAAKQNQYDTMKENSINRSINQSNLEADRKIAADNTAYNRSQDAVKLDWDTESRTYTRARLEDQTAYDRATAADNTAYTREQDVKGWAWKEDDKNYTRNTNTLNRITGLLASGKEYAAAFKNAYAKKLPYSRLYA